MMAICVLQPNSGAKRKAEGGSSPKTSKSVSGAHTNLIVTRHYPRPRFTRGSLLVERTRADVVAVADGFIAA